MIQTQTVTQDWAFKWKYEKLRKAKKRRKKDKKNKRQSEKEQNKKTRKKHNQNKTKRKKERKQKEEKSFPLNPTHFPEWFFTWNLPVSSSNSLEHKPFTLLKSCYLYGTIFVAAIVFFELFKAIYFSNLLIFWISAMRLFIFMNFFSLVLKSCYCSRNQQKQSPRGVL